jgi:hypothetical protein
MPKIPSLEAQSMADKQEPEVVLKITTAPEYRGVFVTEAIGGQGPNGIVVMDLCHDYRGQESEMRGKMVGADMAEISMKDSAIMIREKQVRVYLPADSAIRLGTWLSQHGKAALEAIRKEAQDGNG